MKRDSLSPLEDSSQRGGNSGVDAASASPTLPELTPSAGPAVTISRNSNRDSARLKYMLTPFQKGFIMPGVSHLQRLMSELQLVFSSGVQFDYETGLPIITVTPKWQEALTIHPAQRQLLVIIERGEGDWFVAHCPAVKGAFTQGKTIDEVMDNMADVITLLMNDRGEYTQFVMTYRLRDDKR